MKALTLALVAALSFSANATSILVFRTEKNCETAKKVKHAEVLIQVQKAQDGQTQLVITQEGQQAEKIQVKEILPPRMMAGGSIRYVGKDTGTNNNVTLSITSGTAPIKVGKTVGRSSTLNIENRIENLALVCGSVK